MSLILVVDEANTGASMLAESVLRRRVMTQGVPHKVMSAGTSVKKDGAGADPAWRGLARSVGLNLDRAQSRGLKKKDAARAAVRIALTEASAAVLRDQGLGVESWLPTRKGEWPCTRASVEAWEQLGTHLLAQADPSSGQG